MLFKFISNIIIASVAFQLVPGNWTEVAADPSALSSEIIRGEVIWAESLPEAENVATAVLPMAEEKKFPTKIDAESLGVKTTATSVIVVDFETGKILFEKNPEAVRAIASITKLAAALVFLDNNPGWDEPVTITNVLTLGNNNFYSGEMVTAKDLFYSALVGSDNTAANNFANAVGMSMEDFVKEMNVKAGELGLVNTFFVDPVGLDPDNKSTALDLVKILREAAMSEDIQTATRLRTYEFRSISNDYHYIKSTDDLLSGFINRAPYTIVAGKTGSLLAAGYCLALAVEKDGHTILIISLNSADHFSRFQDVKSLTYWTFNNYIWPE